MHRVDQINELKKAKSKRKKFWFITLSIAAYPVKAFIVYYTGLWSLMVWLFFEHLLPLLFALRLLP